MQSTTHPPKKMTMSDSVFQTPEYRMIAKYYGDRVAERSQIPLMNHIDEGIEILMGCDAAQYVQEAFCLHPLIQGDADLEANHREILGSTCLSMKAVMLATEYRRAANAYLCKPETDAWSIDDAKKHIGLLLPEIRLMLIADKVQNRKDFMAAHYGTHARSDQLLKYFNNWHEILGIPQEYDPVGLFNAKTST